MELWTEDVGTEQSRNPLSAPHRWQAQAPLSPAPRGRPFRPRPLPALPSRETRAQLHRGAVADSAPPTVSTQRNSTDQSQTPLRSRLVPTLALVTLAALLSTLQWPSGLCL